MFKIPPVLLRPNPVARNRIASTASQPAARFWWAFLTLPCLTLDLLRHDSAGLSAPTPSLPVARRATACSALLACCSTNGADLGFGKGCLLLHHCTLQEESTWRWLQALVLVTAGRVGYVRRFCWRAVITDCLYRLALILCMLVAVMPKVFVQHEN